jgi:two-component system chemotaxis response regulator CheB
MIGVFLVEDSPIALQVLTKIISDAPDVKIVGTADNGRDALLAIPQVNPDIICTDLYMKGMDGLELIQQIMTRFPKPILVISVAVGADNPENVFQLLQAGAIDVLPKPTTGLASDYNKRELLDKIRVLAGVKVFTRSSRSFRRNSPVPIQTLSRNESLISPDAQIKLVAIGTSTGGPQAVFKILRVLPKDFPVPILCTQHISAGFLDGLVSWMNQECQLTVKIAEHGEILQGGVVYYAPDGFNLEVNRQQRVNLSPPCAGEIHCPSVNVMFRSVALHNGSNSLAVLLTGMGEDGAKGMLAIAQAGGITIVQDEASCAVFGMPKAAIDLGAVQHILEIDKIGNFIVQCTL